jgi:hypothetical protein
MRIISDFHDYYDTVQATGQDQTLIYFRKREEVSVPRYSLPVIEWSIWLNRNDRRIQVEEHVVGFCGKIYPVIVLTQIALNKSAICYNLDEVDSFFESNCRKKEVEQYRTKGKRRGSGWLSLFCREAFEKHFAECAEKKDAFVEVFFESRCPVWIGTLLERSWRKRTGKIDYNASLKELEFFRLFDTYTAFQEIAMFLGGLAVPLKEIPRVPDKIMVGIKGFDEWSFRRPPREK